MFGIETSKTKAKALLRASERQGPRFTRVTDAGLEHLKGLT
jgi:hypothetical protein